MLGLKRRPRLEVPRVHYPLSDWAEQGRHRLAEQYAFGCADGMRITLQLLLGQQAEGGQPFSGPLTVETRAWAERALQTLKGDKRC